jgi:hypothetical protein
MNRMIKLVFTDETEWATVLEAFRKTGLALWPRTEAEGDTPEEPLEEWRASVIALWARDRLDAPRPVAQTQPVSNGPDFELNPPPIERKAVKP